jgi:hypothetical protein
VLYTEPVFRLLYAEKIKARRKNTIVDYQKFVFQKILAGAMASIAELTTINRLGYFSNNKTPVDVSVYKHQRFQHSTMRDLDKYISPNNNTISPQNNYRAYINKLPSLNPNGMLDSLLLPRTYLVSHIKWIYLLARIYTIETIVSSAGPRLRKDNSSELQRFARACKRFAQRAETIEYLPPEQHKQMLRKFKNLRFKNVSN